MWGGEIRVSWRSEIAFKPIMAMGKGQGAGPMGILYRECLMLPNNKLSRNCGDQIYNERSFSIRWDWQLTNGKITSTRLLESLREFKPVER